LKIEDVIIVGAGPAGLSCALQLNRYGINPLIFEKDDVGGLLRNANLIENYPGIPSKISGLELVELFKEQILEYQFRIINEEVKYVDFKNKLFHVDSDKNSYDSKLLVLAAGTLPKKPVGLYFSDGVKVKIFYEIFPIINCENKRIVIIGAGDMAFDYALNLGKKNNIVMMNRSDRIKCIPILQKRIKTLNNFQYFENTEVHSVSAKDSNILIEFCNKNIISTLYADYLIFAIGRESNRKLITDKLRDSLNTAERENKLFEIGDTANGIYRQTAIAAGDGIKTAMKIYQILN
jgi:thioredoxin reductase (NADPH)